MNTPTSSNTSAWKSAIVVLGLATTTAASHAQSVAPAATTDTSSDDAIKMSAFSVSTEKDYGYRKLSSVTSSKTGELVSKMPQAIEVISSELLTDFNANNGNNAFRYSSSVTVKENAVGQADMFNLRGFALPRYYNGVALANALSAVPINIWDNVDRIEVVKGPVGLYYANSTPNGVANFITKKPQWVESTSLDFTYGSYGFQKVVADHQEKIGKYAAMRVIASAGQRGAGYHDGSPSRYTFLSPSVVVRPFERLEITAELDYLSEHEGYAGGANVWNFSYNPLWQQNLNNPSAAMIAYFRNQPNLNLGSDDAARTYIKSRWSPPNTAAGVALATWSNDVRLITGTAPFLYTTQDINWSIFSPRGDRMALHGPQSTYGGTNPTYEASVVLTPIDDLSIRYHWVHTEAHRQFIRQIIQPNTNGFRPDGRVNSLDVANLALQGFGGFNRIGKNDTQQLDAAFEREFFDVKHKFAIGYETLRTFAQNTNYAFTAADFAKAGTITTPSGQTLTGIQIYQNYDPFGTAEIPGLYALQGGPLTVSARSLTKNEQYYGSYRASAFDDRVNFLFGVNKYYTLKTGNTPRDQDNTTYTYGIIGEVIKGFSVFASKSEAIGFTNQQSAIGAAVLPSDNVRTLDSEQSKGWEAGFKTSFNDNEWSGTVSYYNAERSGVVGGDVLKTLTDPRNASGGVNVQFFVNGGLFRSRGIDSDIIWTPNRNLQMVLNYNHSLEARIVADPTVNPTTPGTLDYQKKFGRPLSQSPKNRVNLIGKYNFTGGTLNNVSVGGAIRYSDTYSVTNGVTTDIWVPSQTMLDMFIAYQTKIFSTPTSLRLNVTNVTDEMSDYTWGDGRTIYGSIGFKF